GNILCELASDRGYDVFRGTVEQDLELILRNRGTEYLAEATAHRPESEICGRISDKHEVDARYSSIDPFCERKGLSKWEIVAQDHDLGSAIAVLPDQRLNSHHLGTAFGLTAIDQLDVMTTHRKDALSDVGARPED